MIILRHPLGAGHISERIPRGIVTDCGTVYVEHWLRLHEALEKDIAHLYNAVVVMFEHFQMGDSQGIFDASQTSVGLSPSVRLQFAEYALGGDYEVVETPWRKTDRPDLEQERAMKAAGILPKRKLLEFRGSRANATVFKDSEYIWMSYWQRYAKLHKDNCTAMYDQYEQRVNRFGYSLHHPRQFWKPAPFADWYVPGFDDVFQETSVAHPHHPTLAPLNHPI